MQYIWLIWSLLLLIPWGLIYFLIERKEIKRDMLLVSFWTSLLGLTEPLFVPAYWAPPSLFNLALRTGFDIESLIFSFGIGGIAFAIYYRIFHFSERKMSLSEKHNNHHRYHMFALISAPVILAILLLFTPLNPLHSSIIAMTLGGIFSLYCRPDLKNKMIISAIMFLGLYFVYFLTLIMMSPGYVERVWNLKAISGILIVGIPLEELLFAVSFGFLWSSVYEHATWHKVK
jgi:hypothetical protein